VFVLKLTSLIKRAGLSSIELRKEGPDDKDIRLAFPLSLTLTSGLGHSRHRANISRSANMPLV
jgi:hypothetical protein